MSERLFEIIDGLYPEYVKIWEDVCNIESPTACKEGVDRVGKYLADYALARGYEVEYFRHDVSGDVVCITSNKNAKEKPITISGHMDTVHPLGLFGTPAVKIEGDKMYGPGVTDCKGGIIVGILAMAALDKIGFDKRPVQLLLQSDEEGGSRGSKKATIGYMCEKSANSAAFLNLEPASKGKICVQRKGIITFTFKIKGIEAHSSSCATMGANAIAEAAYKIIELEKLKDKDGLTCNCGVISGGSVPNTVAGYCEFKANVRFVNSEQLAWVREYARKVAETVHVKGCECTLEEFGFRVAMEKADRNYQLAEKINGIFDKVGLSQLELYGGLGGSDAADVTVYGKTPCVDCLGVLGGRIHSPEEYAEIDSLKEMAKRIASIIYYF